MAAHAHKQPSLVLETLLALLPRPMAVASQRTLRRVLEKLIPTLDLTIGPSGEIVGWTDTTWQRIWARLLGSSPSIGSRRRYKSLLLEAARIWMAAGLVKSLPELEVPPQHRRRTTVSVDRLGGFRPSGFRKIPDEFLRALTGKWDDLVPEGLRENFLPWVALGLILSGFCVARPVSRLMDWIWADVPLDATSPLRRPNRQRKGSIWQELLPLARLLLLALYWRMRMPASTQPVFQVDSKVLSRSTGQLLARMCKQAGLPCMRVSQVIYFVRLDLRQVLNDLHLAQLIGMVKSPTVPPDQVAALLKELDTQGSMPPIAGNDSGHTSSGNVLGLVKSRLSAAEIALRDWLDQAGPIRAYSKLIQEIEKDVSALYGPKPNKGCQAKLQKWTEKAPAPEDARKDLPRSNLVWLVRMLLHLVEEGHLQPSTIGRYYVVTLDVMQAVPDRAIWEIDQAVLEDLVELTESPFARQVPPAWRRLLAFCAQHGIRVPTIDWTKLVAPKSSEPVRALTAADQQALLQRHKGTSLGRAMFLARYLLLRAGEIVRMLPSDLDSNGRPCAIISRSKRGRSRRVPLDHLEARAITTLIQHGKEQTKKGRSTFLSDEKGNPLGAQAISESMLAAYKEAGLRRDGQEGRPLRLHDWRAAAADWLYRYCGDIRYVALLLGHSLVITSIESYLRTLDLQAVLRLRQLPSPLNRMDVFLPLATLAAMLDREVERVSGMVQEYNQAHAVGQIVLQKADSLPDGVRPARHGIKANYINLADALNLIVWFIEKRQHGAAAVTEEREARTPKMEAGTVPQACC